LDGRGYPVAAVWITGPAFRLPEESFSRLGAIFEEGAREISEKLGLGLAGQVEQTA
jgi:DNA-binding IclR family transcriptional regulator